jgi:hypothetical protein
MFPQLQRFSNSALLPTGRNAQRAYAPLIISAGNDGVSRKRWTDTAGFRDQVQQAAGFHFAQR